MSDETIERIITKLWLVGERARTMNQGRDEATNNAPPITKESAEPGPRSAVVGQPSESERWLRAQLEALCAVAVIEVERLEIAMMATTEAATEDRGRRTVIPPRSPVPGFITDAEARRKLELIDSELTVVLERWRDRWMRWMNGAAVPLDVHTKVGAAFFKIEEAVKLVAE